MNKQLAFVLGGGGARGALQVGALLALLESGLSPYLLVGTSIGAVNAVFLGLHGFTCDGLEKLSAAWREVARLNLLPSNYIWLTLRAMLGRSDADPSHRIRDFFIANGITPELTFADLPQPRVVIVSADLNSGKPVLHGASPQDPVLEALLLSTALPPWVPPVKKQGRYLMDGGVVSNLPIEPAVHLGATEIVALDLMDMREVPEGAEGVTSFLDRLICAVEKRQVDLELEVAEAHGIPILYMGLTGRSPVPFWDFQHSPDLMTHGYELALKALQEEQSHPNSVFRKRQANKTDF